MRIKNPWHFQGMCGYKNVLYQLYEGLMEMVGVPKAKNEWIGVRGVKTRTLYGDLGTLMIKFLNARIQGPVA